MSKRNATYNYSCINNNSRIFLNDFYCLMTARIFFLIFLSSCGINNNSNNAIIINAYQERYRSIYIDNLRGVPFPVAKLITISLSKHLKEKKILIATGRDKKNKFLLKGHAKYNPQALQREFNAIIYWNIFSCLDRRVGTYVQRVEGTPFQWEFGDNEIIERIGISAAKNISVMIKSNNENKC